MIIPSITSRALLTTLAVFAAPRITGAQCDHRDVVGIDDIVFALTMWDPDGPGPRAPVLVIGGSFTITGGMAANHVATWDPATGEWGTLGSGTNGGVRALITLPGGDLVAGGSFTVAGGEEAQKVARWDGEQWHAMGRGLPDGAIHFEFPDPGVYTLAITPRGELMAGGNFFLERGDPTAGIHLAVWDGDVWRPLEQQLPFWSVVQALLFMDGGDLIAGGYMDSGIARWDGAAWSALGAGLPPAAFGFGGPMTLATGPAGELIAGGLFLVDLGAGLTSPGVVQWDGAQWRLLGEGVHGAVSSMVGAMLPRPDGSVIVSGGFDTAGGEPAPGLAGWDGEEWSALPGAAGGGIALAQLPSGDIAIGHLGRRGLSIWGCRGCYADCDGDGQLDFLDFLCFQGLFAAADPGADCDGDSAFTFFDFLCFQNAFAAGCP